MRVAITGAASGIGAAAAAVLKHQGAQVVAFDRAEPATDLDQWICLDMADPESIAAAVHSATGRFDALLNIAGLPPRKGQASQVLAVNYVGLVGFTRQFVDKLNAGGSIVNLASRAGNDWQANTEQVAALMSVSNPDDLDTFVAAHDVDDVRAYHLSKEALIVWTMQQTQDLLRQELRMNCVSPAAVSTGILPEFKAAFGERATKGIALAGRAGSPQEIAELVAFLARPESSWIRGANIAIDGGLDAMLISEMLGLREA